MCVKRQAEEFVEFCEKVWGSFLKSDGYIKINLLYSIKSLSESKNKDYSKLREKIKKDLKIETKKYEICFSGGYIKISPKIEKIKLSKSSPFKEEDYFLGSIKDLEEFDN